MNTKKELMWKGYAASVYIVKRMKKKMSIVTIITIKLTEKKRTGLMWWGKYRFSINL